MNVLYINEDIFFNTLKSDCIFNYKISSNKELLKFCFCLNDDIYILNQINIKIVYENIEKIDQIYIYDLKEFSKPFVNNGLILNYKNFVDIKIILNDIFRKDIELEDDEIKNISSISLKNDLKLFSNKNYELDIIPYQIFNENLLNKSLIDETNVLNKIKQYIKNNYVKKEFTKILHESSITYSIIENNKCYIDFKHPNYKYSNIKNYFIDYIENTKLANLSYNLTKTSTGRLSSNFHTIQKKFEKCIVSRFEDQGIIVSLDFSNFEIKTLFKIFKIKNLNIDLYSFYSTILNKNRTELKNSIIPFLYGYKVRNKELENIKELKELKYRILDYIKNVKKNQIVCNTGKTIVYNNLEDVREKSINNICQNEAVYIFLIFLNYFSNLMISNNIKSKIIATKHDSIILDCFIDEYHLLSDIIKQSLKILENEFVVYTLKCNKIGEI